MIEDEKEVSLDDGLKSKLNEVTQRKIYESAVEKSVDYDLIGKIRFGETSVRKRAYSDLFFKFTKLVKKYYKYYLSKTETWQLNQNYKDFESMAFEKMVMAVNSVNFEKIKKPEIYGFWVQYNGYLQAYTNNKMLTEMNQLQVEKSLYVDKDSDGSSKKSTENSNLVTDYVKENSEITTANIINAEKEFEKKQFWEAVNVTLKQLNKTQRYIWDARLKSETIQEIRDKLNISSYDFNRERDSIKTILFANLEKITKEKEAYVNFM
jgi:hypothetical protein